MKEEDQNAQKLREHSCFEYQSLSPKHSLMFLHGSEIQRFE